MNESERLRELKEYGILDTLPEKELDEIVELASTICGTPISLISLVDDKRQWFKAKLGLEVSETPRSQAFCSYAIQDPDKILVVDDPLNDDRFRDNPLVTGDPNIRFYAGIPLKTPAGNALGTLCVIDNKPKELTPKQRSALRILSNRVMKYLETKKKLNTQKNTIKSSSQLLTKLTDQAPGAIYQFEIKPDGKMFFPFISKGISSIHPKLTPEALKDNAELGFTIIHPLDVERVRDSIMESYKSLTPWNIEYRIVMEDGSIKWNWANSLPKKHADGTVVWYGTFQDVTERKEYIESLRQMSFSISHVIRRPVASLLGLVNVLETEIPTQENLMEYVGHFKTVAHEMDNFLNELNEFYNNKRAHVSNA